MSSPSRPRARRLPPDTRRGLIADAAEALLATHDPLLVTFEQVADAAGVSRALVHTYVGDRRGLVDAVQVQIIGRLDTWVGHGFNRATTQRRRLEALVQGVFAFVEADADAWGVLGATGGLDHPALHGVRARWAEGLSPDPADPAVRLAGQAAVGAVVAGVGSWTNRGVDARTVTRTLATMLEPI